MIEPKIILNYLHWACEDLLLVGNLGFKKKLRPTQREALIAYKTFLERTDLSDEEKLSGFFEIPTGVGKTALFGALIERVLIRAKADKIALRIGIVAPRTNLLTQTKKEFIELAHTLKYKIGLYGGPDRKLGRPITIITYESFANLTDQSKLSGDDFDILISDEAHRGTSETRAERLLEHYEGIVRLAFTATAHFDTTKSVINTHKHQIFEKHIPASIKAGELAAYIQTQNYVVRVSPESAEKDRSIDNRIIRQVAFNKFVEKRLLVGRDTRTGDLLTDNQGGIFTSDTAQANVLERKLNANPELQRRARERGCKAFAVAIHTVGISPAEQKRREEDFKAGKYLFIIGDEKFKEGADYPMMKTVIDSEHGSLVDKAQILGRGARRWRNPRKRRQEGLAFLDPIIYIGSDDPKEDKKRREEAIARSILAADILDGSAYVGDPHFPPLSPLGEPGIERDKIDDGMDVTCYTTFTEARDFLSERDRIRRELPTIENWPWSAEYQALCELRERKGDPGAVALFRAIQADEDSELFGEATIFPIIKGNNQSVQKRQLAALSRILEAMPDNQIEPIKNWPKSEEYQALCALRERKGNPTAYTLFQIIRKDAGTRSLFGRTPQYVGIILKGEKQSVEKKQIKALNKILEAMPDKTLDTKIENWPESQEYSDLCELRKSKGNPGCETLLSMVKKNIEAKGLFGESAKAIEGIIKGAKQFVWARQIEILNKLLKAMPDKHLGATIENWPESQEYRDLCKLRKRKGNPGNKTLFRILGQRPEIAVIFGSTPQNLQHIIMGHHKYVFAEQAAALIEILEAMPDKQLYPVVNDWPNSSHYKKFYALWQCKGSPGSKLLFAKAETKTRGMFNDARDVIESIIKGQKLSVERRQIVAVIKILKKMPDKQWGRIIKNWSVSDEYQVLCVLWKRKGSPGRKNLYKKLKENPEAIEVLSNENVVEDIIKGSKKSVSQKEVDVLTSVLEAMPDVEANPDPHMHQASRAITRRTKTDNKPPRPPRKPTGINDGQSGSHPS